jgi:hypothetical protein
MYVCLYILWKNLSIEECTFMRLYGNLSMYVRMYVRMHVCTMISRRFPLSSIMLFYVMLFLQGEQLLKAAMYGREADVESILSKNRYTVKYSNKVIQVIQE